MMQYTCEYNLYWLYDRAFEDCMVDITVAVPNTWKEKCPKLEEVKFIQVRVQKDTEAYLKGVMRTNIKKLLKDIKNDLNPESLCEHVVETMADDLELSEGEQLDGWYND